MLRQSHVRRRQYAVGLAVVSMATVAGCGSDASPESNRAAKSTPAATPTESAPGTFVSDTVPYRLKLLHGWSVGPNSSSSGGEELVNADLTEALVVGHTYVAADETVADRVKANLVDEISSGACVSDVKQQRPIEVGGEPGILWSYTCTPDPGQHIQAPDTYSLAAQTIHRRAGHRRVGYRFTVVVPLKLKKQAPRLMNRWLAGLTFLDDSSATGDE
jgi:hypothetical protein